MKRQKRIGLVLVAVFLSLPAISAAASTDEVTPHWPAPATWDPPAAVERANGASARSAAASQASSPLPFVGMTPCRIADTRGNGFTGVFGPPPLVAGSARGFPMWNQCGIPASAAAVSLNVTVTNTQGPGFLSIFPAGGAIPPVSTLNFAAGQTVANAAVVPIGNAGAIAVVAGVSVTDLIIDVNGFYGSPAGSAANLFLGDNSGNATLTGTDNTGVGREVLGDDTTGAFNTAFGQRALELNTTGAGNSGFGHLALQANPAGNANVALGVQALLADTASDNTALGHQALISHTSGIGNVAVGRSALGTHLTTAFNIGIGFNAGGTPQGFDNDMYIGCETSLQGNTILIGDHSYTAFYAGGIYGESSPGGTEVFITGNVGDAGGIMGSNNSFPSSRRFKEEVSDVGPNSDGLMRLRPVVFRYKSEFDPAGGIQYGLVAEEVEEIYRNLVVRDRFEQPLNVRYDLVNVLLLDVVQKQRRRIDQRAARIRDMEARLASLEALLADRGAD